MREVEETRRLEVAHANGPHFPVVIRFLHCPPGAENVAIGLVDEQEVDIVRLQFAQTLTDGGSGLGLAVVAYPYFGHQENILTRYTGFRDGGTHAFFVVIGLGGVNKAITDGKGIGHAALRFLRRDLEYAVAEKGHLNTVGKGCVLHGW